MTISKIRVQPLNALDAFTTWVHWRFSEERRNPYRCPVCGGTHIQLRAWILPNRGNRYVDDCEDIADTGFCLDCNRTVHACTTDGYRQALAAWWAQTNFQDMQRTTGLHQSDFSGQNGYQDFLDACNAHWNALPIERQITIWHKYKTRYIEFQNGESL